MFTMPRLTATAAGFLLAVLALVGAPDAFAKLAPDPPGPGAIPPPATLTPQHTGTALWVFLLVAAVAVLLTIAATMTIHWLRQARAGSATRIRHA